MMEFVYDRERRANGRLVDLNMRSALENCLDDIVRAYDRQSPQTDSHASPAGLFHNPSH
jgi:hypothetical protein